MSKIIEKSVHYQLQDYHKENGLLYEYKSGFRAISATDSRLPQLTDFVLTGRDKGMHTDMMLIDLQKAYNTLDHKIFLEKMTCLGFKTLVIKWFESYLSSKKIFVSVDDVFSEVGVTAVPLRGLFGATAILINIDDLHQS